MNKILHQSIPASPIKSLGRVPGLANAWPLGSTKFVNAPPLGLTMRANANGVGGGGGTWVQLELTDALIYNKASVILLIWRAGACSSLCLESVKIHDNSKNCTCTFVQARKLKQGLIKN